MFTVKHVSIGGRELVVPAVHVFYVPKEDHRCAQSGPRRDVPQRHVKAICPEFPGEHYFMDGTVFVMNDAGATVSRWDLGASPVPLRDDVTGANVSQKIKADDPHP